MAPPTLYVTGDERDGEVGGGVAGDGGWLEAGRLAAGAMATDAAARVIRCVGEAFAPFRDDFRVACNVFFACCGGPDDGPTTSASIPIFVVPETDGSPTPASIPIAVVEVTPPVTPRVIVARFF